MSDFEFFHRHKTVEKTINGEKVLALELLDNPYTGIIFTYGKVSFDEDEENDILKINFEYDIHKDNDLEYDQDEFQQYLGNLLQELIIYGLRNNDIVYTGGTDDNREDNSQQSDL